MQPSADALAREQMQHRYGGFSIGLDYLLWFSPAITEQHAGSSHTLLWVPQRRPERLQRLFGELTATRFDAPRPAAWIATPAGWESSWSRHDLIASCCEVHGCAVAARRSSG